MTTTPSMTPALKDVAFEMIRARHEEGYTLVNDMNREVELLQAGTAYAYATHAQEVFNLKMNAKDAGWPQLWHPHSWKPKNFRANLVRAAALIIFAIEAYDAKQEIRRKATPNAGDND